MLTRDQDILNQAERSRVERERHRKYDENRRTYKTRNINYGQLVTVRIDHTTTIYARPGEEETTKKEFLKQYKRPLDKILAQA